MYKSGFRLTYPFFTRSSSIFAKIGLLSCLFLFTRAVPGGDGRKGRYAFASGQILTEDILDFLTQRQLKILRNEIYARHGYIFKTPDMKSYFAAESWYQPDKKNYRYAPQLFQDRLA